LIYPPAPQLGGKKIKEFKAPIFGVRIMECLKPHICGVGGVETKGKGEVLNHQKDTNFENSKI
jgi:hypothetical protein